METLSKMLNVFSWIALIGCPLLIVLKIWLQIKYQDSLERSIDILNGVYADYTNGLLKLLIMFVVSLVYLIVK